MSTPTPGTTRSHWYDRGWGLALRLFESTRNCEGLRTQPAAPVNTTARRSAMPTGNALKRRCATVRLGARVPADVATIEAIVNQADAVRIRGDERSIGFAALQLFVVLYTGTSSVHSGVHRVTGCDVSSWQLVRACGSAELRERMHPILMGQGAQAGATATILLVLDIAQQQRLIAGDRGLLDAYIDSGRLAQRLVLAATAEGLRTHQTPAVRDPMIEELLDIRAADSHVVYTISVG